MMACWGAYEVPRHLVFGPSEGGEGTAQMSVEWCEHGVDFRKVCEDCDSVRRKREAALELVAEAARGIDKWCAVDRLPPEHPLQGVARALARLDELETSEGESK